MDKPNEMKAVSARVPLLIYAALDCVRRSERRTWSQVIRNVLEDWYNGPYQDWWDEQQKGKTDDR